MNKLTKVLRIVVFASALLMIRTESQGGRESEYSDKYPKMTFIASFDNSMWFAGTWFNRLVVTERDPSGRWRTFSQEAPSGTEMQYCSIRRDSSSILFSWHTTVLPFEVQQHQWKKVYTNPGNEPTAHETPPGYSIRGWQITVQDSSATTYELPQPSFNAYRRWRGNPNTWFYLDASIGNHVRINDDLWFIIEFYDGEGYSGVGGLGAFDLRARKFGIYRDSLLAYCSSGFLAARGDTLFVATNFSGEYGTFGCNGLVVLDLHRGAIMHVLRDSLPLDGSYFLGMQIVRNTVWMLTDRAIVSWNLDTNEWTSARVESVVTTDSTVIFWGFNDVAVPTWKVARNTTLEYYWPAWRRLTPQTTDVMLAEVSGPTFMPAWVDTGTFNGRRNQNPQQFIYNSVTVFADSSLQTPAHTLQFASMNEIRRSGKSVLFAASGLVPFEKITPVFTERFKDRITPVPISESRLMKHVALDEALREQAEIRERTPLYDTVLTIDKHTDLYDHVLDAMWLPTRSFEADKPTGIEVTYDFPGHDGASEFALQLRGKSLHRDSIAIGEGDSWEITGPGFVALFRLLGYKLDETNPPTLHELKIHYTLRIVPLARIIE